MLPPRRLRHAALLLTCVAALSACGSGTAAEPEAAEGRTVDTLLGPVTVPAQVDSVVVLEGRRDLDVVLSLDLPLVGYPYEEAGSLDLESPLADRLAAARDKGAKELFLADEINLEAIAAAAPDLIVSRVDDVEPIRAELEAIAPVLAIGDQSKSTWQDDLRLVGRATGREDRADALIAEYDERVAELSTTYAAQLAGTTFAPVVISAEKAEVRPGRLMSTVLTDLGAKPSTAFAEAVETGRAEFGPEQLLAGFGDAGALIPLVNDPQTWEQVRTSALYQQLPAVRDGHAVRSDKQTHEGAATTALHCLDVVEQLLKTL
ncbi:MULTISPECIES: ABC transporter substrate-binding protein [Actinosynnema]|uniref:ABC transporter substrate-binding protein n=1 Tax=Actinosynnema TaxID=40566 RepID=UPI0020A36A77|nr:ABC transporter substrate-binding protein [Actinosynnema pretiosum]MCP2096491.1 iron complex transport system substrate-binding protein [Actinosynnema pretiosum]